MSLESLIKKMNNIRNKSKSERMIATQMLQIVSSRIFDRGEDSDGAAIGNYSDSYMKERRKKNYTSSRKVILQATGDMLSDFSVVSVGGKVGLGFKFSDNLTKVDAVELTYEKKIFYLTDSEKKDAFLIFNNEVKKQLNG